MKLFEPKSREGNPNDPYMINKSGSKVQVPENMVLELMKKGFTLVDRKWQPTRKVIVNEDLDIRNEPLPLEQLKENLVDILEITEV